MGSNVRYAAHYDRLQEERILESFTMRHGPLQSLSEDELELDRIPMTVYPEGHRPKVKAWVRFGPKQARVDAVLARSTSKAAGVEFEIRGKTYQCWVWGNAVEVV